MRILLIALSLLFGCHKSDNTNIQREEEETFPVQTTQTVVKQGMHCTASTATGDMKCMYRIGKDLEFTIWGIGFSNASMVVDKTVGESGDYSIRFIPDSFCAVIMAGTKTIERVDKERTPEDAFAFRWNERQAFISPANGMVYDKDQECELTTKQHFKLETKGSRFSPAPASPSIGR